MAAHGFAYVEEFIPQSYRDERIPFKREPYPTQQIDLARKQAKLLHCPDDNSEDMLACLRSRPVANFTDTMIEFFVSLRTL